MGDDDVKVSLNMRGELAAAFRQEYAAAVKAALESDERAPTLSEIARAILQDGLRRRGYSNVEDSVGTWGGQRKSEDAPEFAGMRAG